MEVTFLFTNVADSTALLQRLDDRRYGEVLAEHQRLLRAAFQEEGGVAAALAAQWAIIAHPWPEGAPVRVRMALHTGEASPRTPPSSWRKT